MGITSKLYVFPFLLALAGACTLAEAAGDADA
jgi:hypothetical protein